MTDLHVAASIGFGVVGVLIGVMARRVWRAEMKMRERTQQVKFRRDREDDLCRQSVARLCELLDAELVKCPTPNVGLSALRTTQKMLEDVYWKWLAVEAEYFNIAYDDTVKVVGIHNGMFRYELPATMQKYKRK